MIDELDKCASQEDLIEVVKDLLRETPLIENSDGTFEGKYLFNKDLTMTDDHIGLIFNPNSQGYILSSNLMERLTIVIDDYNDEVEDWYREDIYNYLEEKLLDRFGMEELEEIEYRDVLREFISCEVYVNLNYDHFYNQLVNVDMIIDTGDSNYDFNLNTVDDNGKFPESSSLKWLCGQQGYTIKDIEEALELDDDSKANIKSEFVKSVVEEIDNCSSDLRALTLMLNISLQDAVILNELIRNNLNATIHVDKNVMVGLVDFSSGSGGLLDIKCEKDMDIPVKLIMSALPDCVDDININEIYGLVKDDYPICKNFKINYEDVTDNIQSIVFDNIR